MNTQKKGMTGKDIITVGIFSAIYFVINFAFMLLSGLHPLLWILMPGLIAVFAGIPFLMMCTKVPKTGAVVLMGFITALIYFVTGQFTVVILIAFAVSCILAELCRICSHYRSFRGNALAYVFFSLGMIGSPLPVWIMRDSFLAQISQQGMPEAYVSTLAALTSPGMIVVLVGAPTVMFSNRRSSQSCWDLVISKPSNRSRSCLACGLVITSSPFRHSLPAFLRCGSAHHLCAGPARRGSAERCVLP